MKLDCFCVCSLVKLCASGVKNVWMVKYGDKERWKTCMLINSGNYTLKILNYIFVEPVITAAVVK